MEDNLEAKSQPRITPEEVRVLLKKTDWSEHDKRVAEHMARVSENYRRASIQAYASLTGQYVFY